jgi:hypothetical protein
MIETTNLPDAALGKNFQRYGLIIAAVGLGILIGAALDLLSPRPSKLPPTTGTINPFDRLTPLEDRVWRLEHAATSDLPKADMPPTEDPGFSDDDLALIESDG